MSKIKLHGIERATDSMLLRLDEGFRTTQSDMQGLAQQLKLLQLGLIFKPSLQRDAFNELGTRPDTDQPGPQDERLLNTSLDRASIQIRNRVSMCTCFTRKSKRFRSLLSWSSSTTLFRSTEVDGRHQRYCPFYYCSAGTHNETIGVRFKLPSFLASTLQLSMSFMRGAGGMAISPMLVYRPIVPWNSPAFSIFSAETMISRAALLDYDAGLTPTPYMSSYIMSALSELLHLFNNGEASPYDITANGETLLHVSRLHV